jgi:hypothetical protein
LIQSKHRQLLSRVGAGSREIGVPLAGNQGEEWAFAQAQQYRAAYGRVRAERAEVDAVSGIKAVSEVLTHDNTLLSLPTMDDGGATNGDLMIADVVIARQIANLQLPAN